MEHNKKIIKLACVSVITILIGAALIGLLVFGLNPVAVINTIEYNTTTLEEISHSDGKQVTVTGYMSMVSPVDETMCYLMSVPFNADPMAHTSNSNVTDMVACYPPTGSRLTYTEQCIKMTGTICKDAIDEDTSGYSYPFYLTDCTYVVFEPNDLIKEYNFGINSGALHELDTWLTSIYTGMASPASAVKVDIAVNKDLVTTKIGDATCENVTNTMVLLTSLSESYNDWVDSKATVVSEDLSKEYYDVGTTLSKWFDSLGVKGNEE